MFKNRYNTTFQYKTKTVNDVWQHEYYADGSLKTSGKYLENEMDGEWKHYRKGGRLSALRSYKNGIKDGVWEKYDANGVVSESITYNEGKKVK